MLTLVTSMSIALPNAHGAALVYDVNYQAADQIRICVERPTGGSTRLFTRSGLFAAQLEDLSCDGKALDEDGSQGWLVPASCLNVCWCVRLADAQKTPASAGQSVRRGPFVTLSELSSLPRFADEGPEGARLRLTTPGVHTVVPTLDVDGGIYLPPLFEAPLVLLLDAVELRTLSTDDVELTYLIDDADGMSRLPSQDAHLKAASWLRQRFSPQTKATFTVAWVGVSAQLMSATGMATRGLLVTNYPTDGVWPLGDAMMLYVALHEAVHQLAPQQQATWLAESIASYYGMRAMQVALPGEAEMTAELVEKFRASAATFSDGLLVVNRQVIEGNWDRYGAF
jgi:hypothetical protein